MSHRPFAFAALLFCACGNPGEVRVGAAQGIPEIKGSSSFTLAMYTCGQPITAQGYTVTTRSVDNDADCEFTFDQLVEVIKQSDYQNIPDLQGTSNLVQAVEIEVKTLAFTNADTGMALDLNTYVKSAVLKVEGQQVADKSTIATLPATVTLTGDALTSIKSKVDARQPASVHATAVMVVPKTPAPPDHLKIDYDAQPTLVLGTGKINLGG